MCVYVCCVQIVPVFEEHSLSLDLKVKLNYTVQVRCSSLVEPPMWSQWSEPHHIYLDSKTTQDSKHKQSQSSLKNHCRMQEILHESSWLMRIQLWPPLSMPSVDLCPCLTILITRNHSEDLFSSWPLSIILLNQKDMRITAPKIKTCSLYSPLVTVCASIYVSLHSVLTTEKTQYFIYLLTIHRFQMLFSPSALCSTLLILQSFLVESLWVKTTREDRTISQTTKVKMTFQMYLWKTDVVPVTHFLFWSI